MIGRGLAEGLHISPRGLVAILPRGTSQGLFEMSPAEMEALGHLLLKRAREFRAGEIAPGHDVMVALDG
ncbi:MAG: hypothetical protein JJ913_08100 [Rhizobiaceae bacterium]|nr:hypothetical protein [Rhizobiaceae bacterium]